MTRRTIHVALISVATFVAGLMLGRNWPIHAAAPDVLAGASMAITWEPGARATARSRDSV